MVIKVLDVVSACNTAAQGTAVADKLRPEIQRGKRTTLSFQGVTNVPSSFVNASIIALFNELSEDLVVSHLVLSDVNNQIASMIRRCIENNRVANRAA